MNRGDVYDARLDPIEGSEQAGYRPVIIVSRNSINESAPRVIAVPCTSYHRQRIYPTNVFIQAGEGGLDRDSLALCDQIRALSKSRLATQRGTLSAIVLSSVDEAILIALDQI